jgi:hypothetical protein
LIRRNLIPPDFFVLIVAADTAALFEKPIIPTVQIVFSKM